MGEFGIRSLSRAERLRTPTAVTFCYLYAAGCVDMREREALQSGEHAIKAEDFAELHDCVEHGTLPSDETIRRIFRRPFEKLGDDCTLEEMQHYWRVDHSNLAEKTPVFKVQVAPYVSRVYPREDRNGVWWETYVFDARTGGFEYLRLHNTHRYDILPGAWVYIHNTGPGFGIIAEEVPADDEIHHAFAV